MLPPQVERSMTPPPPEDDSDRRQAATEEGRAMIASLPLDEQPAEFIDDPGLAAILARLGRAIMDQNVIQTGRMNPGRVRNIQAELA